MEHQHDERDAEAAIDKALRALSSAAPPEGMEARIAQRLQHRASAQEAGFSWRDLLAGSSLSGAWWRGALTGAAIALFAVSAVLLLQHDSQTAHSQVARNQGAAVRGAVPTSAPPIAQVKADKPAANPSPPAPDTMQLRRAAPAPKAALLRAASTERHPILSGPLTAQERGLLLLARTADPQQLAMLNSEAQAKLKAQDAAEFEKFFAPPPQPKTQQENE